MAKVSTAQRSVLMLLGDYAEDYEVMVPFQALQAFGVAVDAVCPGKASGEVCRTAIQQLEPYYQTYTEYQGHNFVLNATFDEINAKDYDGLLIPGGRAPEYLAMDEKVLSLVREFMEAKKPIIAVCHGQLILAAAGVVGGRKCTAYPAVKSALVAAGAHWVEHTTLPRFVVDGNLITAVSYMDHPWLIRSFVHALGGSISGADKKILFLCGDFMEDYEVMVPF
ncbi:protein DJ-1 homolog D-like [Dioscorea cayenensis subsp. rotundata]|uniref:Protein DJ-1 homolog D-like n=1 Tax=Dioscorea cayennensis subsp. rotundata TaxID=55577 RepID=A0AB40CCC7_DIOCR|nr:protein DJ-1 homolog D-like [Dioscorea cayenensis subsp. rotundata]